MFSFSFFFLCSCFLFGPNSFLALTLSANTRRIKPEKFAIIQRATRGSDPNISPISGKWSFVGQPGNPNP